MTLTFIIASIAILVSLVAFRQLFENKKYRNTVYLSNLQQAVEFISLIQTLNDYITWVHRDKIKTRYISVGRYFKTKLHITRKRKM